MDYYNKLIEGLKLVKDLGNDFYYFLVGAPIEFQGAEKALLYEYSKDEYLLTVHGFTNHNFTDLSYLLGKGYELEIGYKKGKSIRKFPAAISGVIKAQPENGTGKIIHFFKVVKTYQYETTYRSAI